MKCPKCGTDNQEGFSFCVVCGANLSEPPTIGIDQVDMGGYYSEGEDQSSGFTIGSGTFVINDRTSPSSSSDLYTADELNDSDEEFDFSIFDEPFIPKLDTERITLPEEVRSPQQNLSPENNQFNNNIFATAPKQLTNSNPLTHTQQPIPPINPAQPQMYGQPQFIGYDPNGVPIYSQPMMYGQPQFIGYDPNGMPIYSPPILYGQPQITGYDQNGTPIYSQPQLSGYDQNGSPIYSQPQMYGQPPVQPPMPPLNAPPPVPPAPPQGMSAVQGIPPMPSVNTGMASLTPPPVGMSPLSVPSVGMAAMPLQSAGMDSIPQRNTAMASVPLGPEKKQEEKRVDVPDDFWAFFDGGKATKRKEQSNDDFFGKSNGMDDVFADRKKKAEPRRNEYMSDLPIADASSLRPNDSAKFNNMYMSKTDVVDGNSLAYNEDKHTQDRMRATAEANADTLLKNREARKWNIMGKADSVSADELDVYVPEHKQSMMAQADKAVEALPKRHKTFNDEIDEIELPDYMKARRTAKSEKPEISALPEL